MSKTKTSLQEDLELFLKLESLYHALKLSVQDPIIVPSPQVKPRTVVAAEGFPLEISRRYFYAEDDGPGTVRGRIEKKSEEIQKAYTKHKEMSMLFHRLDANAAEGKRLDVARNIYQLYECLFEYGRFIHDHQRYCPAKKVFFRFPNYLGGNISHRAGVSFTAFLPPFNPKGNAAGFHTSLGSLSPSLALFQTKAELSLELKLDCVYTGNEPDSYEASLHLTKMLLKEHFDFDVEGKYSPN